MDASTARLHRARTSRTLEVGSKKGQHSVLPNRCDRDEGVGGTDHFLYIADRVLKSLLKISGLRAAFRAYRDVIEVDGPDPRLPGELASQYDHDQLFFLNHANFYCVRADQATQDIDHSHSPSKWRLVGPLRNVAAFSTAFDCPRNSTYAKKGCNIWISKL